MLAIHRHPNRALAAALLVFAFARSAEASGANVRWTAVADTRVAGYRVYVRPAGTCYGAGINVGRPAAAADGSISYTVSGLTAGASYRFGVTAYSVATSSAPAEESGFSRELAIGAVDPCRVDRATPTSCEIRAAADGSSCDDGRFCNGIAVCAAGHCQNGSAPSCGDGVACTVDSCSDALARCVHQAQPGCCTRDDDCLDTDACTTSERCVGGTCVSTGFTCPPSSCADAYCHPLNGCGLEPTPDGITCSTIGCYGGGVALEARRVVLGADSKGARLNLRARFEGIASIDPTSSGLTLEVGDGNGDVIYRAGVPAGAFVEKRAGTKYRYRVRGDASAATGGISGVVLKQRRGTWSLSVRASSPELLLALAQPSITLTARFGNSSCAESYYGVACDGDAQHVTCR